MLGSFFMRQEEIREALTDDFLAGLACGMTDGRKKIKGFRWFRLEFAG